MTQLQPTTMASELFAVQQTLAPLVAREKELKESLFLSLKKQKVRSVKLDDGTLYTIAVRGTLEEKDKEKARDWAEKNYCLKLDTTKALKILRRELKLPRFFAIKKTEYLVIKRPNETTDEE
jgi:hypothetical protein